MKKVVFVCRGNIFRSQIAKAIYNSIKTDGSIAYAYGTSVALQKNEGLLLSAYPGIGDTISVMKKHGLDISNEHCTQLKPEHLEGASKIIVMAEKADIPEWLHTYDYEYWVIPNPETAQEATVEKIYSILEENISKLSL